MKYASQAINKTATVTYTVKQDLTGITKIILADCEYIQ